jgi:hypothetical protein
MDGAIFRYASMRCRKSPKSVRETTFVLNKIIVTYKYGMSAMLKIGYRTGFPIRTVVRGLFLQGQQTKLEISNNPIAHRSDYLYRYS